MAQDYITQRGQFSGAKPDSGGAVLQPYPVLGIVKDNTDTSRTGKLRVLLVSDNTNLDPNDDRSWKTVNFMSPFAGSTEGSPKNTGYTNYLETPHSYGMWFPAPDIGTMVLCVFIAGKPDYGFYLGCVPDARALSMIPAIGSSENIVLNPAEANSYGGARQLPTVNINPSGDQSNTGQYYAQPRSVHSYQASILFQQGTITDTVRGTVTTSAQRETPSRVWGVSSPGRPVYSGGFTDQTIKGQSPGVNTKITGRRGGHTFIMDDGDLTGKNNMVRLRTANGHTIVMSDDGQTLMIMHSNGQSWIELGREGTIDMYATNSVNIRTQGDLNLHADRNVNINAGEQFQLRAKNTRMESLENTTQRVGGNYAHETLGNYGVRVGGSLSLLSSGPGSFSSSMLTFTGKPINLNTGSASFVPGQVSTLTHVLHPDSIWSSDRGWLSTPSKLNSITSRAPSHHPWPLAGFGVAVDVKMTESSALPSEPTPAAETAVASAQETAAASAPEPQPGSTSTVPTASSATAAVAATQAAATASIPGGLGGVANPTAAQAAAANLIKPGAAPLVEKLMAEGKSVPAALLTGKDGIKTLADFQKSATAQVNAVQASVQAGVKTLAAAGVVTGNENSSLLSGMGLATAVTGSATVIDNIKTSIGTASAGMLAAGNALNAVAPTIVNTLTSAAPSVLNNLNSAVTAPLAQATKLAGTAQSLMAGGINTAKLTEGVNTVAAGFTRPFQGLDQLNPTQVFAQATAGLNTAFTAIKNSLPKLPAGVPVNVREVADQAAAAAQSVDVNKTLAAATGAINGGLSQITSAVNAAVPGLASITATVNSGIQSLSGATNALQSGIAGIGSATGPQAAFSTLSTTLGQAAPAVKSVVDGVGSAVRQFEQSLSSASVASQGVDPASAIQNITSTAESAGGQLAGALNQTIATASTTLSTLPGGLGAVASVVNSGSLGTLSSTLDQAKNALASSTGLPLGGGQLSSLANTLTGSVKNFTGGLSSLTALKLPASVQNEITSRVKSLNTDSIKITLPEAAVNTNDSTAVQATAVTGLNGDTVPPPPQYSDLPPPPPPPPPTAKSESKTFPIGRGSIEFRAFWAIRIQQVVYNAKFNWPDGTDKLYTDITLSMMIRVLSAYSANIGTETVAQQTKDAIEWLQSSWERIREANGPPIGA